MYDIISHALIGIINLWGTVLLSRMLTESQSISRAGVAVLTAAGVVSMASVILNFAVVYVLVNQLF